MNSEGGLALYRNPGGKDGQLVIEEKDFPGPAWSEASLETRSCC